MQGPLQIPITVKTAKGDQEKEPFFLSFVGRGEGLSLPVTTNTEERKDVISAAREEQKGP